MDTPFLQWLMGDAFGLEDTSPDTPAWMLEAACAGHDPGLWFAEKGATYAEALAVCEGCPVRAECLEHALDAEAGAHGSSRHGVWGGATPRERARLHRQAA